MGLCELWIVKINEIIKKKLLLPINHLFYFIKIRIFRTLFKTILFEYELDGKILVRWQWGEMTYRLGIL